MEKLRHVLLLLTADVDDARAGLKDAGVDPQEVQIGVRLGNDFENQGRQRFARIAFALNDFAGLVRVEPANRRDVQRRRQVVGYRVQQGLHAHVTQRRAAQHRLAAQADGAGPEGGPHLAFLERASLDVLFHQVVVELGQFLFKLTPGLPSLALEIGGNIHQFKVAAVAPVIEHGLHAYQINVATEGIFAPDRELDRDRVAGQAIADGGDGVFEIRAGFVHLVHEA